MTKAPPRTPVRGFRHRCTSAPTMTPTSSPSAAANTGTNRSILNQPRSSRQPPARPSPEPKSSCATVRPGAALLVRIVHGGPLLEVVSWWTPNTYRKAGVRRGTATSSSTRPGATSCIPAWWWRAPREPWNVAFDHECQTSEISCLPRDDTRGNGSQCLGASDQDPGRILTSAS